MGKFKNGSVVDAHHCVYFLSVKSGGWCMGKCAGPHEVPLKYLGTNVTMPATNTQRIRPFPLPPPKCGRVYMYTCVCLYFVCSVCDCVCVRGWACNCHKVSTVGECMCKVHRCMSLLRLWWQLPQTGWLGQQRCIFSQQWRLEVQSQGVTRVGLPWGLSPCLADDRPVAGASSQGHTGIHPRHLFVHPDFLSLTEHQSVWVRDHPNCASFNLVPDVKALCLKIITFWGSES